MRNLVIALIILAGAGFLFAVIGTLSVGPIMGVSPEGFSRGSSNLALIAIALSLWFGGNKNKE
jgi:formate hydrogenlyase subunit 3/multisubunit Na+/H+ antiporter MnhD subunit